MRIFVDGRERTDDVVITVGEQVPIEKPPLGAVVRRLDPRKVEAAAMQKAELGSSDEPITKYILETVAEILDQL